MVVSTTRWTPKKLRVVSISRSPGCQKPVTTKPTIASAAKPRRIAPLEQHPAHQQHQRGLQEQGGLRRHADVEHVIEDDGERRRGRCGPDAPEEIAHRPAQRAGQREQRRHDEDRILVGLVEQMRREQAGEDAADDAAERSPEIEFGEPRGRRPPRIDLAVARERQHEQRQQIERHGGEPVFAVAAEQRDGERRGHERHDLDDEIVREPRSVAEHRHEGEQVKRERQHPEQRRGRDIGRDVGGDRDHEPGRDRGERGPGETVAHGRRRGRCRHARPHGRSRRAPRSWRRPR